MDIYKQYKGLLFTLAYQLTGSAVEAEDAVQDVFLKAYQSMPEHIAEPKAYLCKMVTNRCLDLLKSARKKREQYVGPWLPEPMATSVSQSDPYEHVARHELLSYAMLALLERLTPAERIIFVLREAFCFEYAAIGKLVEKSEASCRQLYSRAKKKLGLLQPEMLKQEQAGEAWIGKLVQALETGEINQVMSLLAQEAVLLSDGGGKVTAAVQPVVSSMRVAKFIMGLFQKLHSGEGQYRLAAADINGQPAIVIYEREAVETVILLHVQQEAIHNLYFIRNPDKLKFIGRQL